MDLDDVLKRLIDDDTWVDAQDDAIAALQQCSSDIAALRERVAELEKFTNAFLDNFKECEDCNGSGWDESTQDNCRVCHGAGERIDSIGILLVDLPELARAILAARA